MWLGDYLPVDRCPLCPVVPTPQNRGHPQTSPLVLDSRIFKGSMLGQGLVLIYSPIKVGGVGGEGSGGVRCVGY